MLERIVESGVISGVVMMCGWRSTGGGGITDISGPFEAIEVLIVVPSQDSVIGHCLLTDKA